MTLGKYILTFSPRAIGNFPRTKQKAAHKGRLKTYGLGLPCGYCQPGICQLKSLASRLRFFRGDGTT